jgi:hypothetical protein
MIDRASRGARSVVAASANGLVFGAIAMLALPLVAACGGSSGDGATSTNAGSSATTTTTGGAGGATTTTHAGGAGGATTTTAAGGAGGATTTTHAGGAGGSGPPVVCSSGQTWDPAAKKTADMNPGRACIQCHVMEQKAPKLTVGGTVYPTMHEPNECLAPASAGAVVQITGADAKVLELTVGPTGNFSSEEVVAMPFQAKVVFGGKERPNTEPHDDGDCNRCHTALGTNDAPGRVTLPE